MTPIDFENLPKQYEHSSAQERWNKVWAEKNYFHAEPENKSGPNARKPFTIVIPPPNVTGALHLGHALNNTLQDILIRTKRMQGFNTLWMPGTDHAGIATQAVVEKRLFEEEKKTRRDLGREKLVARIWDWKKEYEQRITGQLKQMGCSCDWDRQRFTLDQQCARAVRETFFSMFKEGYIYRGKRLVNWDTQLQTSVADDETYTEETKGGFWTFKYPVVGMPDTFIRFSTTRPETMLGDSAVCVHPSDERYQHLIGKKVLQPLTNREIPIIADPLLADPTLGTGCVKVTPAHDANDYACWQRQLGKATEFEIINILNPDGTINDAGGAKYKGMDRYRARKATIRDMEELGLYEGTEDRVIPLKYSDRSKTPIEPFLSDQWFVKMGDRDDGKIGLAQMAIDAVAGNKVRIFPERYSKSYLDWLGEKRDWCISRQLWWGHRVPVWKGTIPYTNQTQEEAVKLQEHAAKELRNYFSAAEVPSEDYFFNFDVFPNDFDVYCCVRSDAAAQALNDLEQYCKAMDDAIENVLLVPAFPGTDKAFLAARECLRFGFKQETDVLDTWFSSALWPHSTLGWPDKTPELDYFYPTSVLVTSRDIITLWVARMVLTGLFNLGQIPFKHVFIHPKILDGYGETMSKSKGNGVDPLDIVSMYGADSLRFGIAKMATETQDVRMPVEFVCPHCGKTMEQTQKNRVLPKIPCSSCNKEFSTQWARDSTDVALPRGAVTSDRFAEARNFCNKLWNASRFAMMNLEGFRAGPIDESKLLIEDRWLLSRLNTVTRQVTDSIEHYQFAEAARALYDFAWDEFCSFYVEMIKTRLQDPAQRVNVQRLLAHALDTLLRLLHPITPFVTEEVWALLNTMAPERGVEISSKPSEHVIVASWPTSNPKWIDEAIESRFSRFQVVLGALREVRSRQNIAPKTPINFSVRCESEVAKLLEPMTPYFQSMAGANATGWGPSVTPPSLAANTLLQGIEIFVDLAGHIDLAAELQRNEKELEKLLAGIKSKESKLGNESFTSRAPADVVTKEREQLTELKNRAASMEAIIKDLKSRAK